MRDRLLTLLLVPVLVFPLVVIAAGGDLELVWQELKAFARVPLVVSVYAQLPSPTATVGASPTATILASPTATFSPSPGLTPGPGAPAAPTPLFTRWGYISASIILALVALWSFSRRAPDSNTGG